MMASKFEVMICVVAAGRVPDGGRRSSRLLTSDIPLLSRVGNRDQSLLTDELSCCVPGRHEA